jgi:hypothetical protein
VEVVARCIGRFGRKKALAMLREVPLDYWVDKGESRLRPADFIRVPCDLTKIYFRYFISANRADEGSRGEYWRDGESGRKGIPAPITEK